MMNNKIGKFYRVLYTFSGWRNEDIKSESNTIDRGEIIFILDIKEWHKPHVYFDSNILFLSTNFIGWRPLREHKFDDLFEEVC